MATFKEKFNRKYGFPEDTSHSLSDIAAITGVSLKGIKQIYSKGMGAYMKVQPSVSPQAWSQSRVYSAVMGGKAAAVDKNELNL